MFSWRWRPETVRSESCVAQADKKAVLLFWALRSIRCGYPQAWLKKYVERCRGPRKLRSPP